MNIACQSCKTKIDVQSITSDLVGLSSKGVVSSISGRVFTKGSFLCAHCMMDCRKCENTDETKPFSRETTGWWNPLGFLED